jgi:hypothetical protein
MDEEVILPVFGPYHPKQFCHSDSCGSNLPHQSKTYSQNYTENITIIIISSMV